MSNCEDMANKYNTKYKYEKLDNFLIYIRHNETGRLNGYLVKNAYTVSSGESLIYPNWYELVVHKELENSDYKGSWVVSEKTTGMIIFDRARAGCFIKTRDTAVENALKFIKARIKTKARAIRIIDKTKQQLDNWKKAVIEESLNENI